MHQKYLRIIFKADALNLIDIMNKIIREYERDGLVLTVRQLYYQLVVGNHIPNHEKSYKRVTRIANNARLSGKMDWDMIEDRTRSFRGRNRWDHPSQVLRASAQQFHMDMWATQDHRVFCVVEKEALFGVLSPVCNRFDVPLLAAKGYPSSSVLREFVIDNVHPFSEQNIHIIHLGDHDPSGIDMTRDLRDRIGMFCNGEVPNISLTRLALNMDQVDEQKPPPNPAKMTDSRVGGYIAQYGRSSWELDALNPRYLAQIVTAEIESVIDFSLWERRHIEIEGHKTRLLDVAARFEANDNG